MRLGTVFIVACMVVIAASAGALLYLGFGLSGMEATVVALAVLTALGLYSTFATRTGVRSAVGSQLGDLSRSNFELGRQVNELNRRIAGVESRVDVAQARARAAIDPLAVEISELGTLVRQLAETVATYEARFGEIAKPEVAKPWPQEPVALVEPVTSLMEDIVPAVSPTPIAVAAPPVAAPAPEPRPEPVIAALAADETDTADEERLAVIRRAIDANRIDLYLQPIVTLPQRKVRYFEAM